MDQDRIIRFSFPGIAFIATILTFDWIFGGHLFKYVSSDSNQTNNLVNILGLIASTPVLGLLINSIPYSFLFICPRLRFSIPNELRKAYLQALNILTGQSVKHLNLRQLTRINQLTLRNGMQPEAIGYMTRRFTFYLTHVNMVFAILIACVIVIAIQWSNGNILQWETDPEIRVVKWSILTLYVLYIPAAIYLAFQNFRESCRFEVEWMILKSQNWPD